jgi:hypothetical protein
MGTPFTCSAFFPRHHDVYIFALALSLPPPSYGFYAPQKYDPVHNACNETLAYALCMIKRSVTKGEAFARVFFIAFGNVEKTPTPSMMPIDVNGVTMTRCCERR